MATEPGLDPLSSKTVSFDSLPLGARFRYPQKSDVFVKLENGGCGIVADWDEPQLIWPGQGVYSFADSEKDRASGMVEWIDQPSPVETTASARCPHGVVVDNPGDWLGWSFCEKCPDCIAVLRKAYPFDAAAILADPHARRISMSFQTQAQYEAALIAVDMADTPPERSEDPVWFSKQQMREVARICNPSITDDEFSAMWTAWALAGPPKP